MTEILVYCDRGHPRADLARLRRAEGAFSRSVGRWDCAQLDGRTHVQALDGNAYVSAAPTTAAGRRRRSAAHPDRDRWKIECPRCRMAVVVRVDEGLVEMLDRLAAAVDHLSLDGLNLALRHRVGRTA